MKNNEDDNVDYDDRHHVKEHYSDNDDDDDADDNDNDDDDNGQVRTNGPGHSNGKRGSHVSTVR